MKKKHLFLNSAGTALLLVGIFIILSMVRAQRLNGAAMPAAPLLRRELPPTADEISGEPSTISLPSLDIIVSIIPGYYDTATQQWTLTRDNAQYATATPEPNDKQGNTFIYGHARASVFGSLPKLQIGAGAIITTSNRHTFYYRLRTIKTVNPGDSQTVFAASSKPILTLQTCTGLFYQYRQLFTFDLEKVV